MNKIEELIDWYIPKTCQVGFEREMMIKYAEHYAQLVISKIKQPENKIYNSETGQRSYVIDDNFKLPYHE